MTRGTRWYRTGDAGIIEDDVLRVRGRIDNVIVSGGINVSLDRVERIVRTIPGLESAVVVGVPTSAGARHPSSSSRAGEALRRSESTQLEEARIAVADEIGAHARPARLVLVDDLATLPSGKPDRETIRRGGRRPALTASGGRLRTGVDDAEPVALGVFEHDPVRVVGVAVPVDLARAEREQPRDLGGLIVGVQVEMHARADSSADTR